MATLPLSVIPLAAINKVISARGSEGAHSYYNSGWKIKNTPVGAKAFLPGSLIEGGSFTVVFQHTGLNKNKMFSLILGKIFEVDRSRVSIQAKNKFTCGVKESGTDNNDKSLPLDGIKLVGFHVWRFENTKKGLEVFLDGRRCVKEGSITDDKEKYMVLKGDPAADSPIVVWETHEIIPDITNNFFPEYMYLHEEMKLGVGSYVEFYGRWDAPGPEIFVNKQLKLHESVRVPGEQIFVVRVFTKQTLLTTSLKPYNVYLFTESPIFSSVEITRPAKRLYNFTIFFAEIIV